MKKSFCLSQFIVKNTGICCLFLVSLLFMGCQEKEITGDFSAVESGFITTPDTIQTSVYWYWISDNISKEAVVKDLHSMKQVGINRAFIGNIGLSPQEAPYGETKLFTEEWWEIMHAALKTATELDIEIGIFNCPGWSQSGGPWIKPEQAMRYLASSELKVKGPKKIQQKLEQPTKDFQDVKVVAWPIGETYEANLLENAKIKITPQSPANLTNGKPALIFTGGESTIDITLSQQSVARSLVIYPAERRMMAEVKLQAKVNDQYKTIKEFKLDRSNPELQVGFDPYAPVAISFPEVSASDFRLVIRSNPNSGIERILLSPTPIVERYAEKSLAKMFQTPLPYWHDYLWEDQVTVADANTMVAASQVVDISQYMDANGILTWEVPEGEWIIMRSGMAPTGVVNSPASPEGTGLEVDKMSKKHVADHFDAFLGKIIERIPAEDRKTWKVVVEDSYETGGQNFTDGLLEEFQQRYGYDPIPFLPVFNGHTIGNPDLSDRFLWDIRRLVADKVSYDYVGGLREVSNKHGLTTWLENYGHWGFPGEFLQYGGQSDEIGGEFWSEGSLGDIENRAASSCAHIYGKTKVSAESFTCGGLAYSRYPATMKRRGDWSFTEGINNTLLHVYIQQPYEDKPPGVNAGFGNEFNRLNTWYNHLDLFVNYLKCSNFMLQQGLNVADVAYFIGEDAPKMTGVRDPEIPAGYSFDYINAEVIEKSLEVKDGKLVLPHGTTYRVLVLPKLATMRPEVLKKIEKLVADGAVILGPPPSRSPSMENFPASDQEIQDIAGKMWGDLSAKQRTYGKGTIYTDMTMEEVFDALQMVPDCLFDKNDPALYNHRQVGDKHIYFITNQTDKMIELTPKFRVKGMQPELWNAVTGDIRPLPEFTTQGELTSVPLRLEAFESAFVIFRKKGVPASGSAKNYPENVVIAEIDNAWKVTFESDSYKRGPKEAVTFSKLMDWSKHDNEQIKYYSGTAWYKTSFTVAKEAVGKPLYLDLGKLTAMAKVKINGEEAGGVWTAPYRLSVADLVKEGENSLEIEVTSTWVNRLIGDQRLPAKDRPTWAHNNPWRADSELHPSGLFGPVRLFAIDYYK